MFRKNLLIISCCISTFSIFSQSQTIKYLGSLKSEQLYDYNKEGERRIEQVGVYLSKILDINLHYEERSNALKYIRDYLEEDLIIKENSPCFSNMRNFNLEDYLEYIGDNKSKVVFEWMRIRQKIKFSRKNATAHVNLWQFIDYYSPYSPIPKKECYEAKEAIVIFSHQTSWKHPRICIKLIQSQKN